ncbi:ACT domain-containing protein, partial [Escherichia coli]
MSRSGYCFNPETLERVLRVVRHRGFHVCSMNMAAASDAETLRTGRISRSGYCFNPETLERVLRVVRHRGF